MFNVLSYLGMSLQSEVCLWTLVGLMSTIFDATLFKTNANLKQVWQMNMPVELSCMVQRILRTMISGVMLVQCFTVYVFLASYIVLLYPVFLEERPTLVLPWLLLAAIRKLLCELMSLAMGLGVCLLLGPARTACIKFVINKIVSIMPFFYMWMLVFSYYHALKIRSSFKSFSVVIPAIENDYGLELAVRRRRTKSLFNETQLRKKLVASLYGGRTSSDDDSPMPRPKTDLISRMTQATETDSRQESKCNMNVIEITPSVVSDRLMSIGTYEGVNDNLTLIPRDVDRILDQFTLMMLRIGTCMRKTEAVSLLTTTSSFQYKKVKIETSTDHTISSPGSVVNFNRMLNKSHNKLPSYVKDYPLIFLKKPSESLLQQIEKRGSIDKCLNKALHQSTSVATQKLKFVASQESKRLENIQAINKTEPPKTIEQATSPIESKQASTLYELNNNAGALKECLKPQTESSLSNSVYQKLKDEISPQELTSNIPSHKLENATSTEALNQLKPLQNLNFSSLTQEPQHEISKKFEQTSSLSQLQTSASTKSLNNETFPQEYAETSEKRPLQTVKLESQQESQHKTLQQEVINSKSSLEIQKSKSKHEIDCAETSPHIPENIAISKSNQTESSEILKQELTQGKPLQRQIAESSNKQSFLHIERKITLKITRRGKNNLDGAIIENTECLIAQTEVIPLDNSKNQTSKDNSKG